jgi:hypothetical protein
MAYVATSVSLHDGDRVEVAIRNRKVSATLMRLPFYRREHVIG